MKTLYLSNVVGVWVPFQYENLYDLNDELAKKNIKIGYGAIIGDNVRIGYKAIIGDNARIGDKAIIGDNTRIGDNAIIGDNAKINRTLFFKGSQHTLSYWGEDRIQIGCKGYSISDWQKKFKKIGELEGYTEEQILEYKGYIDLITQLHETWNINKESFLNEKQ